jgi:DNA end-binding protein Ku
MLSFAASDQGAEEVRQEAAQGVVWTERDLMPIAGKKASKEAAAKKPAARAHRKSA